MHVVRFRMTCIDDLQQCFVTLSLRGIFQRARIRIMRDIGLLRAYEFQKLAVVGVWLDKRRLLDPDGLVTGGISSASWPYWFNPVPQHLCWYGSSGPLRLGPKRSQQTPPLRTPVRWFASVLVSYIFFVPLGNVYVWNISFVTVFTYGKPGVKNLPRAFRTRRTTKHGLIEPGGTIYTCFPIRGECSW